MDKEKGEGTGGNHLQSYLLDELFAFWDCFPSLLLGNKFYLVIRHIPDGGISLNSSYSA